MLFLPAADAGLPPGCIVTAGVPVRAHEAGDSHHGPPTDGWRLDDFPFQGSWTLRHAAMYAPPLLNDSHA